jgi:hypothetical protein
MCSGAPNPWATLMESVHKNVIQFRRGTHKCFKDMQNTQMCPLIYLRFIPRSHLLEPSHIFEWEEEKRSLWGFDPRQVSSRGDTINPKALRRINNIKTKGDKLRRGWSCVFVAKIGLSRGRAFYIESSQQKSSDRLPTSECRRCGRAFHQYEEVCK